jgi:hypothetical protein
MHVRLVAALWCKGQEQLRGYGKPDGTRGDVPEHARKSVPTGEKLCDGVLSLCFLNLHCGSLSAIALSFLLLGVVLFACATIELDYWYIIF